ncbi:MAG: transcriptional regulator [Mycobacteriaceae bacterium]
MPGTSEEQTRHSVARLVLERGPVSASAVAAELGLGAAGVRRHLDALCADGEAACASAPVRGPRGRGRPPRSWVLTEHGRVRFGHAYDDLAVAALRQLREIGGDAAVAEFARRRVAPVVTQVREGAHSADRAALTTDLAAVLTGAGYAASVHGVGSGVQLCQHHCPVAHVAAEFPELCAAEQDAFADLLGTPVQRLATIANGDPVCTTHVPLDRRTPTPKSGAPPTVRRTPPATAAPLDPPRSALRKENA